MSASRTKNTQPHGQVRQSQVVTTFGPGSLFDLPNHSVIVGGLEYWTDGATRSSSPGWSASSSELLERPEPDAVTPRRPTTTTRPRPRRPASPAWQFPEWFITQGALATRVRALDPLAPAGPPRASLTKGKFIDHDRKPQPVVPVRFVRACRKGHIGDIDWYYFVHQGDDRLPPRPLDRRARDQRRPLRSLGPLRVQGRSGR